ncbi:MAG TPA: ABC transporter ATP-binding protein [Stellaceae bacterium]|nr:ABC transporter ATP-binding protein [Stellaceae bacterium]
MLEVADLVTGYGRSAVLHGVSLDVAEGAIVGVLGPNGAGKTTLVKAISGLLPCRAGRIVFEGRTLAGSRVQDIVRLGLLHVPQGRLLFPEMTVQENLEMGAYLGPGRSAFRADLDRVHALFPILEERQGQLAGVLSGGEQQMLAIGRALMSRPRLLILDEPSIGLAPRIIDEIFEVVRRINRDGTSIVLVEQNARRVLRIASHCVVLESGRVAVAGSSADLLGNELVRKSYLGLH